jgi:hypothetical protein
VGLNGAVASTEAARWKFRSLKIEIYLQGPPARRTNRNSDNERKWLLSQCASAESREPGLEQGRDVEEKKDLATVAERDETVEIRWFGPL